MANEVAGSRQHEPNHATHDHAWAYVMSRRHLLGATATAAGALATSSLWSPLFALADDEGFVAPKPIPGGVAPFGIHIHHFPPLPVLGPTLINEPSQITDFDGWVGITRVKGTGTGIETTTEARTALGFQVDNGFMSGRYVGEDGEVHRGTFAFV